MNIRKKEKTMKCKAFKKKSNTICKVYNNQ